MLDSHPKWSVNLKRVRRLLGKVVSTEGGAGAAGGSADLQEPKLLEEDVEDWCLITAAPPVASTVPAAKPVAALSATARSRRR